MRRCVLALVIVLALVAAACTKGGDDDDAQAASDLDARFTTAELLYGLAPEDVPGVEYQDDVVIVEGGAQSIRGMSPDGLSWTIDGSAGGVDDVEVGSVLFVTGRAVGRVLAIEEVGDDRKFTVGPVELTEVYKELDLQFEQPIDLASMPLLQAPELPGTATEVKLLPDEPEGTSDDGSAGAPEGEGSGASGDPANPSNEVDGSSQPGSEPETSGSGDSTDEPGDDSEGAASVWDEPLELEPVRLIAFPSQAAGARAIDPPSPPTLSQVSLSDFGITSYTKDGVGIGLKYDKNGVRMDVLMAFRLHAPTVRFDLKITDGKIERAAVDLHGAAGLTLQFVAASQVGLDNNVNGSLVIPVDISLPVFGLRVPFAITFSQRILVKTAFSAKNSTLMATGDYGLSGGFSMGFQNGSFKIGGPTGLTVKQSLLSSIDGISLGVNGIVLSHAVRVIVGIGAFGFATGPYFDFISSFGVTNGSDLGIVKCKGGSLDIFLGAGIGYQVPKPVTDAINFFLRALNLGQIQQTGGVEVARSNIVHKEGITPASKICREGA
ncbi:MAG TPA: hypothetical protein VF183_01625 [Acidimicrobiales bacterium]